MIIHLKILFFFRMPWFRSATCTQNGRTLPFSVCNTREKRIWRDATNSRHTKWNWPSLLMISMIIFPAPGNFFFFLSDHFYYYILVFNTHSHISGTSSGSFKHFGIGNFGKKMADRGLWAFIEKVVKVTFKQTSLITFYPMRKSPNKNIFCNLWRLSNVL